jgi:hypothetical protein
MKAKAAAFTGYRVNPEIFDSIKAAKLLAQPTLSTPALIYVGHLPAPELGFLFYGRAEQQMKVGSIHIAVGKHLTSSQSSERADYSGLPRPPFTA